MSENLTIGYRVWYFFYKNSQVVRHWFGIHQKQKHFSIAPRCDWCGHRSKKQKEIALKNREGVNV